MDILEKVKELYPEFGTVKTAKMMKVRQSTIKKIVEDNNLEKNRRININDFYEIKSKEICYFLGLLWADGHVSKRNYSISIECNGDDMLEFKRVLDVFGKWSYYDRKRIDSRTKTKPVTNAYIYDNLLHDFLVENDYLEKSIKSPYKILSKIPKHLISYFLLGMVDGDGCFYFKKGKSNQLTIAGSNNQDWIDIENIFIEFKIKYKIVLTNSSSVIRVTNVKDIKKIGDFIYKSINEDQIGLKRKYEKYKLIIENISEKERNINYIRENIHKSKKDLCKELGISLFKVNKIIKDYNIQNL